MIIGDNEISNSDEKLVASGNFGLIIYSTKRRQILSNIKQGVKGFFGINYSQEFNILFAAATGRIWFYNINETGSIDEVNPAMIKKR